MCWLVGAMFACSVVGDTTHLAQGTVEAFRKAVQETGAAGFPFHSEMMKLFQWMPFSSYFSTHYYLHESLLKLPELRSHRAVGRTLFPLAEAHGWLPQAVEEYGLKLDPKDVILFVDGSRGFGPLDYLMSSFVSLGKLWKGSLRSWCHNHLGAHFGEPFYLFPLGGMVFEFGRLGLESLGEGKLRKQPEPSQFLFLTSSHLVVRSRPCNHWKLPLSEIIGYREWDEKVDSSKSCLEKATFPWDDDGRIPQLGDDYVGLRLRTKSGVLGRHMLPRGKSYGLVSWKELRGPDFSDLGKVCHLKKWVKSHPNFTEVKYFKASGDGKDESCFSLKWTAEPYMEMPTGSYEEPSLLHAIVAFAKEMRAFTTLDPWDTLERGDRLLKDGLCEEALDNYLRAAKMNPADTGLHEWRSLMDFRIHQGQQCLGIQRPRLGESTCMDQFPELRNHKLIEDFQILSSPEGWRRVKHLEEWRRFFQLSKKFNATDVPWIRWFAHICTNPNGKSTRLRESGRFFHVFLSLSMGKSKVIKAKRKLLKKYHPDKHQADADCAHQLSMWIMAGAELLKEHRSDRTNELWS